MPARPHLTFLRAARAAAAAVAAVAVLAGCGSSSSTGAFTPATPGVLTVATSDIPEPGFWEGTAAHPTGGFEFALAKAIAGKLGLDRVRVRVVPFPRIAAGDLGGADLALSLVAATSGRREHLDFTAPYIDAAPTALVRAGTDIPDLYTAQQLRWGAERGTTFVDAIDDQIQPDTPVRQFANDRLLEAALLSGQIDASMHDLPLAVAIAAQSRGRLETATKLPGNQGIAAALPRGSDNLQAVDSAVRALTADGTVNDLLTRWVGDDAADPDNVPLLHTTL